MSWAGVLQWFAGGATPYRTLFHCMRHDLPWIALTVVLDLAVATGYCLIALHWWRNQRGVPPSPAQRALGNMKNIFVYCGICGYLFIPVKMFWPAWRLYDMFMAVLAFYTWRYAWSAHGLTVVYNELSRSRKLAEDLEGTQAEAKRRSFFLTAIGHDLRTPLNSVVLHAQWAESSLSAGDTEAIRHALAEIQAGAHAAAELLDNLLELGKLDWTQEVSRVCVFSVSESLSALAGRFEPMARQKALALETRAPEGVLIQTDPSKLDRILGNLIDNAIRYTHAGGVRLEAEVSGSEVKISVEDTGPGIACENHALVFDEFFQVHNGERDRSKGWGLGLAIARRLAHQLDGRIVLQSSVGRGSRFTVELPGAVASGTGSAEPQPGSPTAAFLQASASLG
jgi:signal transduction histidine kinase